MLPREWTIPTLVESHLLCRAAGVFVSVKSHVRLLQYHRSIEASLGKSKFDSMREILAMEWAWGKVGYFLCGTLNAVPVWRWRRGVYFSPFLLFLNAFFSLLSVSQLPCFPLVSFWHSILAVLYLTFVLPVFNFSDVCLVLTPPPCFFFAGLSLFQWHSYENGWGALIFLAPCFSPISCLFSHLRWEMELGRQGMDCTLSVRLLTPRCGLSSWEHRGLVLFVLA